MPKDGDLYTTDGGTVFFVWSRKPAGEDARAVVMVDVNPDLRRVALKEVIAAREMELQTPDIQVWSATKDKRIVWLFK